MRSSEAKKLLTAAGFTLTKSTGSVEVFEFDDDIRVAIARRPHYESPNTTREVESAIRRAEVRKAEHEARHPAVLRRANEPLRATRPLTAKLAAAVVVVPPKPAPPPAPVAPPPPPAAPPAEPEEEEDEPVKVGGNRKMPIDERLPLWRRIVVLHDLENEDFATIAERLEREGVKKPSGFRWKPGDVSSAYRTFHKYRELMKLPAGRKSPEAPLLPDLPDYFRGMLADAALPVEKKVAVLKALAPKLPASVALMLEDGELTNDQKLGILAIVLRNPA